MTKGKFALGAVFGALVGVVAGVLTAPKSGRETRADLKAKADDVKKDATKKAKDVKKQAETKYEEARKVATDTVEDVKGRATDYRSRAERAFEAGKTSAARELKKDDTKKS